MAKKKVFPKVKDVLHPRNKHRDRYDFKILISVEPGLAPFVHINTYGDESINFSDPDAVLALNRALLKQFYGVENWSIPEGFLCPPVPGRADYIHYIADLLAASNGGTIPTGDKMRCFDLGVGANCIYPIVGHAEYGWSFVGSDIEPLAIESATKLVAANKHLGAKVELRLQDTSRLMFKGVIKEGERFDFTMCNPPFHASAKDATDGTLRKLSSLKGEEVSEPVLNFGGQSNELYCPGGEERFVKKMVAESQEIAKSCFWFTSLISKKDHVRPIKVALKKAGATEVKMVSMSQGTKQTRFLAWTFLNEEERQQWVSTRW